MLIFHWMGNPFTNKIIHWMDDPFTNVFFSLDRYLMVVSVEGEVVDEEPDPVLLHVRLNNRNIHVLKKNNSIWKMSWKMSWKYKTKILLKRMLGVWIKPERASWSFLPPMFSRGTSGCRRGWPGRTGWSTPTGSTCGSEPDIWKETKMNSKYKIWFGNIFKVLLNNYLWFLVENCKSRCRNIKNKNQIMFSYI